MLPARRTGQLLRGFLRGLAPCGARHGVGNPFLGRTCKAAAAVAASQRRSWANRGWDGADDHAQEEQFLFLDYVPEPEPCLEEQLRELQRRQREEERQKLQQRQESLQQKLRARLQAPPIQEPRDMTVPPPSGIYCPGCGAEMHCQDPGLPGYLPGEKFRGVERTQAGVARSVCQRCWLLVHHRRALRLRVSREQYLQQVSSALRTPGPALVLYMVDLLDLPDVLLPDLPELVGPRQLIVLGNKVDLLPQDAPGHLQRLRKRLWDDCVRAGLLVSPGHQGPRYPTVDDVPDGEKNSDPSARSRPVIKDVRLISAKTGYGVEELISTLQRSWRYRGDVYLVGSTNAGKSTLFNTLLESDYCTAKGTEAIDRATISPWPGTTLNLLKFPICNPTPYRMFERHKRLKKDAGKAEGDLSEQEQSQLRQLKKHSYVIGRIGRTFSYSKVQKDETTFEFDPDELAFDMENEPDVSVQKPSKRVELTPQDVKDAHWFHDTPGITKENCILNLLTDKEVNVVLPTHAIVPRTFVLKPGMVLFLGGIGRIDFLQGNCSAWFTVVASNFLPVHVTSLDKADAIYQKHAGHALLLVPMGGEERMAEFPPLVAEDITLQGRGEASEAVADIKFSSAGWVAVTPHVRDTLHLRGYTPEGTVLTVRSPLLPHIVNVKGERIKRSVAYKTKKPSSLVYNLQKNR